jgi:hypothetical protein
MMKERTRDFRRGLHLHPLLKEEGLGASAVNLPETGDAGFDAEPAPMPVLTEPGVIPPRQRPGPHQAQVSPE